MGQTILSIIFSGVIVALLIAVGQLIVRERTRENLYAAGIFLCLGLSLLLVYLFGDNLLEPNYPNILGYFLVPRFLIGPLAFFYFRSMFLDEPIPNSIALGHLLPTIVLALVGLPFLLGELLLLLNLTDSCAICQIPTSVDANSWVQIAGQVYVGAYILPIIIFLFRSLPGLKQEDRGALVTSATLLSLCGLVLLFDFLGSFFYAEVLWSMAAVLMVVIIWGALLSGFRYPELVNIIKAETMRLKKRPDLLRGIDATELERKLRHLMEQERVYCDEDLQVNKVAAMLHIKPYRLTYFLNNSLNKNFSQYINEYRIDEAKRMLVEEPNRTILQISSAAGFNSKTVFYKQFNVSAGMTPMEYRKIYLSDRAG